MKSHEARELAFLVCEVHISHVNWTFSHVNSNSNMRKENNVTCELDVCTFVWRLTPEKWFIKLLLSSETLQDGCWLDSCWLYSCWLDSCWLDGCWLDGCWLDSCWVCSVDSGSVNRMCWCSDAVVWLGQVLTQVLWGVWQLNALNPSVWPWFDADADYNN